MLLFIYIFREFTHFIFISYSTVYFSIYSDQLQLYGSS